jgi:hypothetical protein
MDIYTFILLPEFRIPTATRPFLLKKCVATHFQNLFDNKIQDLQYSNMYNNKINVETI